MAEVNKQRRRVLILTGIALALTLLVTARPAFHLTRTMLSDGEGFADLPPGVADDASHLNRTDVHEIWRIPKDADAAETQLAELLQRARAEQLRVSIAGARHSMGGHTIYPGGIVIDTLPFNRMELDADGETLHVQAGARWSEIIPYLDERGRSVAVMQSNNSFSVGGSISVNCHGWQYDRPPIASTVKSFRLMQADGEIVLCSRTENAELFSLVLGGYGLFGTILDIDLKTVPNERYRLEQHVVAADQSLSLFYKSVSEKSDVRMVYARLNIVPERLFEEVILNVLYADPGGDIPSRNDPGLVKLRRAIFRGSVGSDYGKELRWDAETKLQPHLSGSIVSRNQLLDEGVEVFQNRSSESTDILHEYFVPTSNIAYFVEAMQQIIPRHDVDLLNVTVRSVNEDTDTFLRYADQKMFALVMLFNQQRTDAGEQHMQAMTRELIDAVLSYGGRYYLPYRLHATTGQFQQAYPQANQFFELKRRYDPDEIFQNQFYVKYGKPRPTR